MPYNSITYIPVLNEIGNTRLQPEIDLPTSVTETDTVLNIMHHEVKWTLSSQRMPGRSHCIVCGILHRLFQHIDNKQCKYLEN
jgi:hypothetical protein